MTLNYPKIRKDKTSIEKFGVRVEDPYRWLEDEHSPETQTFIEQQRQLTQDYLERIPNRHELKDQLSQLMNYEKYDEALVFEDIILFSYNPGHKNQSLWYMQRGLDGLAELLIDPNTLSQDGTQAVTILSMSRDQRYLAYLISDSGSDWQTLRILDVNRKENLPDSIQNIKFTNLAWDEEGFYYSAYPTSEDSGSLTAVNEDQSVYYHRLGDSQEEDRLVYSDPDHPLRYIFMEMTHDLTVKLIFVSQGTYGNEVLICREDDQSFQPIFQAFDSERFFIKKYQNKLLFLTDQAAPNKKIIAYDLDSASTEDLVAERELPLVDAKLIGHQLVLEYTEDVASKLVCIDLREGDQVEIPLQDLGTVLSLSGSEELGGMIYSFTSMKQALSLYFYDFTKGETQLFKASDLPLDLSDLVVERHFVTASDGAQVPMFVMYQEGLEKNGNHPALLYAYGGFNISTPLSFNPMNAFLAKQGTVYVRANIRGGSEYGETWHKQGMLLNKQRVFDDFIECAEYLIQQGFTCSDKLAIEGASNGGLLVGAVVNQRPDLFRVALPAVGVMDMLRYHLFTVGWGWIPEFGDPDQEEHFKNLLTYSPLHNIKAQDFPSVMILTADHDDRVVPAHSFKYGASLQAHNQSDKPILLRIDQNAGHGAGKSLEKLIQEYADKYAFMWWQMAEE